MSHIVVLPSGQRWNVSSSWKSAPPSDWEVANVQVSQILGFHFRTLILLAGSIYTFTIVADVGGCKVSAVGTGHQFWCTFEALLYAEEVGGATVRFGLTTCGTWFEIVSGHVFFIDGLLIQHFKWQQLTGVIMEGIFCVLYD